MTKLRIKKLIKKEQSHKTVKLKLKLKVKRMAIQSEFVMINWRSSAVFNSNSKHTTASTTKMMDTLTINLRYLPKYPINTHCFVLESIDDLFQTGKLSVAFPFVLSSEFSHRFQITQKPTGCRTRIKEISVTPWIWSHSITICFCQFFVWLTVVCLAASGKDDEYVQ